MADIKSVQVSIYSTTPEQIPGERFLLSINASVASIEEAMGIVGAIGASHRLQAASTSVAAAAAAPEQKPADAPKQPRTRAAKADAAPAEQPKVQEPLVLSTTFGKAVISPSSGGFSARLEAFDGTVAEGPTAGEAAQALVRALHEKRPPAQAEAASAATLMPAAGEKGAPEEVAPAALVGCLNFRNVMEWMYANAAHGMPTGTPEADEAVITAIFEVMSRYAGQVPAIAKLGVTGPALRERISRAHIVMQKHQATA